MKKFVFVLCFLFFNIFFVGADLSCDGYEIYKKCGDSPFSTDHEGAFILYRYCVDGDGELKSSEIINCSNGCIDGECIDESVVLCNDSDGKNIYERGILIDNFHRGEIHEDSCIDENGSSTNKSSTLVEIYCTDLKEVAGRYSTGVRYTNKMIIFSYDSEECEFGCVNGACLKENSDIKNNSDIENNSFISRIIRWIKNLFN
ncbi:MAG: hypothetical protein QT05_C0047G0024 [archaeon GW2011_AR13]|nr:MAG: hypothetical protein QT05_C0047G0024 [archaeon GW2011_AR13]HIG94650.1 hypothetical protein [Nanoarchaeota archaeon]HIH63446.1 hypothetical protein [Nanoarchaeota archaeon]HIJ09376.1 hypothetical protein [Nanoarchaeota archaeon]